MKLGVFAPLAGLFATGEPLDPLGPAVAERAFDRETRLTPLDSVAAHLDAVRR